MRKLLASIFLSGVLIALTACGRAPSRLLRQGQLPVYDFPLYLAEGAPGKIWKYSADGSRTLLVQGLNDPRGIATDRWNNLFVVERGTGRLLKIKTSDGSITLAADQLQGPSVVAVDSFGDPYVAQDTPQNIVRAKDGKVTGTFASGRPSGIAFGVSDLLLVAIFDMKIAYWGGSEQSPSTPVADPVNITTDSNGRVYIAEGLADGAKVYRFQQGDPSGKTVVADQLKGPQGIAVDPAQNIYVVEQGAGRIVLVTYDGQLFSWATGLSDPQYIAFTQY